MSRGQHCCILGSSLYPLQSYPWVFRFAVMPCQGLLCPVGRIFGGVPSPLTFPDTTSARSPGHDRQHTTALCLGGWWDDRGAFGARCARAHSRRPSSSTHRPPLLGFLRFLCAAWTQNFPHDPPHPGGTADAAGLAAGHHHPGGACPPGADHPPPGGGEADQRYCCHGRDQPPLCLQMGAAVSGAGCGGIGRPTGPGFSARAISPVLPEEYGYG